MPIRRSALSAFCFIMLGAASVPAQSEDPFAEWDRQNAKPAAKRSVQKEAKSSVTYFSPSTEEAAAPASQPAGSGDKTVPPTVRMREKIATGSSITPVTKSQSSSSTAGVNASKSVGTSGEKAVGVSSSRTASAKSVSGDSTKPVARMTTAKKPVEKSAETPVAKTVPAKTVPAKSAKPPVRTAALTSDSGAPAGPKITRVAHPADEAFGDAEENPFAEFLEASEASTADADSTAEVGFEDLADDADTLFDSSAGSVRGPAAARGRTPVRTASVSGRKSEPSLTPAGATSSGAQDGPQSPAVTLQWIRRGSFNVGQECDVDLVVSNTGKSVVRSVMAEAVIPANVELLEAAPAPMQGSDTPAWTFGEMKPGETRTIAMKVIPRERGEVRMDAFVRLTGFSSTAFSVQEPMISVEVEGPDSIEVGEQVGYVVKVSNPGTGVASNVIIQAAVPEGLEHRSGSILSIEIGTLSAGESRQAKLSLTAVRGGEHNLAVRAIAEGDLTDETAAVVSIAEPQLNISIAGPTEQMTGRSSDFTMTVANSGNVPSENVRAKYRVPEGFEFVSANRGGKYGKVDHSIEWFVGTLQPDETSDFQLTLRAVETGDLFHQAGVISEHGQVTMCDYSTTVEGMAALDLKITASDRELKKGDEVTWEVQITNNGSRSAASVGMSCELPSGIELIDAEGPSEHIAENGIMVFRSLPVIEPGTKVVYTITGRCLRSGNHRLRMRVASESISEALIGEEAATVSDR